MIGQRWSQVSARFASAAFLAAFALVSPGASVQAQTTAPTTAVGTQSAVQNATVTITTAGTLSTINVLTRGVSGSDYAQAAPSGTPNPAPCTTGTAYNVNDTCTVGYTFTPSRPGGRAGGISLFDASGHLLANNYLTGMGTGPQVAFPPTSTSVPSVLTSGVTRIANGLTLDGAGDIFYAGPGGIIQEVLAQAGIIPANPTVTQIATGFTTPSAVVIDGSGNLFVADSGAGTISEILSVNGAIPSTPTVNVVASGFTTPTSIRVDAKGDIYVADGSGGGSIKEVIAVNGVIPTTPTVNTLATGVTASSISLDGAGDVFFAGGYAISELAFGAAIPVPVATVANIATGLAMDGSGDLYVSSSAGKAIYEIVATSGVILPSPTILTLGTGYNGPASVAVDASGNIYVGDVSGTAGSILELNVQAPPAFTFTSTAAGSTSSDSPMTLTLANNGNAALSFPALPGGPNPAISANFTIGGSSTCPQVATGAATAGTLAAGATCTDLISFTPATLGSVTGTLVTTDTSLNATAATQTDNLAGGLSSPTVTVSPASAVVDSTSVTLTASVAYNGVTPMTGLSFSVNSTIVPATCPATASPLICTGTYNPSTLTVGNYGITATLNADTSTNSAAGTGTLTITPGTPGVTVTTLTPTISVDGSVTFTASVTPSSGITPGGQVTFTYGGTTLCAAQPLSSGSVSCTTAALPLGMDTVTATIGSDLNFNSASGTFVETVNQATPGVTVTTSGSPSIVNGSVTFTATVTPASGAAVPTGSVTFTFGSTTLCSSVPLVSGTAQCMTSALTGGSDQVTATLPATTNFTQGSGSFTQVVNRATPTVTVTANPNAAITVDQSIVFTATVGPTTGIQPGGTISFTSNGTAIPNCTGVALQSGVAHCTTSTLVAGSDSIVATIAQDMNFISAPSTAYPQTVNKSPTTLTITSSQPTASTVDSPVALTATLTNTSGAQFTTPLTASITWPASTGCAASPLTQATSTTYTATCNTSKLLYPSDVISLTYAGDSNYQTSGTAFTQAVNQNTTSVTIASNAASAVVDQSVTFTATVIPGGNYTSGPLPAGSLSFTKGGTSICGPVVVQAGTTTSTAACSTSFASVFAATAVTATYIPDSNFTSPAGSIGSVQQAITAAPTTTSVTSSVNPSSVNQSVNLTASLTPTGTGSGFPGTATPQSGSIMLSDSAQPGVVLCTMPLSGGTLSNNPCAYTFTGSGTHQITATFTSTDNNFSTSTTNNQLSQTVGQASASLTINPALNSANPTVNQQVSFTAVFTNTATGVYPTGTVTYYDGGVAIPTCTGLQVGAAGSIPACTEPASMVTTAGIHNITEMFTANSTSPYGNITTAQSTSYALTIGKAAFAVSISSTVTSPVVNQSQIITVKVNPAITGNALPSGPVSLTYTLGTTTSPLCVTSNLTTTGGVTSATCSAPAFTQAGSYTIAAVPAAYSDVNFTLAISPTFVQTVAAAPASTTVVSSINPSVTNQSVTLTATVTATNPSSTSYPGTATPQSGTITFSDSAGGAPFCMTTISNGSSAVCTHVFTSASTAGAHQITASFVTSDPNFSSSTTASQNILIQTVNASSASIGLNPAATSPSPTVNQSFSFTAVFSGLSAGVYPTGTVTYYDNGTAIANCTALTVGANGAIPACTEPASIVTTAGTHNITEAFTASGSSPYGSIAPAQSTSSPISVAKATFTVAITSNTPTPSVNQPQTFTVTVSPAIVGNAVPNGFVALTYTLNNGASTPLCTTSSLTTTASGTTALCSPPAFTTAGSYSITAYPATYSDANFILTTSPALTESVSATATAITITSPTPSSGGVAPAVTVNTSQQFAATVGTSFSGAASPTGTVAFTYAPTSGGASAPICTAAVTTASNGTSTAQCTGVSESQIAGTYNILATYTPTSGTTNFTANTSAPVTQTVTKATPIITLTDGSITNVVATAPVTFTISVAPNPTGGVIPTDPTSATKIVIAQGASFSQTLACTNMIASGTQLIETCTVSFTSAQSGMFTITASYAGDQSYSPATVPTTLTVQGFNTVLTPTPAAGIVMASGSALLPNNNVNDLFFSAAPSPNAPNSLQYMITPLSGFQDTVTTSCSVLTTAATPGVAANLTCAFSPTTSQYVGVVTVTSTGATVGNYTVNVTTTDSGTSSNAVPLTKTVTAPLTIVATASQQVLPSFTTSTSPVVSTTVTNPAITASSSLACNAQVEIPTSSGYSFTNSQGQKLTLSNVGINCKVVANAGSFTVTLTAGSQTTASLGTKETDHKQIYAALFAAPLLLLFGFLPAVRRNRKLLMRGLALLALAVSVLQGTGCSSGGFTGSNVVVSANYAVAGTYVVSITQTVGSTTSTVAEVPVLVN